MSPGRSRSGGIVIGKTERRKYEILAVLTRGHGRAQVLVRRRDDADVDLERRGAADPLELLLLERTKNLRLQGEGQVADLVQKQRAMIRHLELAGLARVRAGERALLVAEQLGLEQGLGNRRAVDRHEGSIGARAHGVQGTREQLFAGAALALEQHRHVGPRGAMERHQQLFEPGILADNLRRPAARGELFLQHQILAGHAPHRQRALDDQQEMVRIDRLGEKVERALLDRRDRILNAAERGHDDHRQLRIQLLGRMEHAEAVTHGQSQVRQHHRGVLCLQGRDRLRLIARFDDGVALRLERVAQHGAKGIFVFNQQNRRIGRVTRAGGHRSQPGGTDARRASSGKSATAFLSRSTACMRRSRSSSAFCMSGPVMAAAVSVLTRFRCASANI